MADPIATPISAVATGDTRACDGALASVYDELRRLAEALLEGERRGHTLQATALVHEAYLKLVDQERASWNDRRHFCAIAAQAMRRILVDHARTRKRVKRGGGVNASLDATLTIAAEPVVDFVALDEALQHLESVRANAARVVELRYFGGMGNDDIATMLGLSVSSVQREWRFARAWLLHALDE